jgi:hypothetical protein
MITEQEANRERHYATVYPSRDHMDMDVMWHVGSSTGVVAPAGGVTGAGRASSGCTGMAAVDQRIEYKPSCERDVVTIHPLC